MEYELYLNGHARLRHPLPRHHPHASGVFRLLPHLSLQPPHPPAYSPRPALAQRRLLHCHLGWQPVCPFTRLLLTGLGVLIAIFYNIYEYGFHLDKYNGTPRSDL